MIILKRTLAGIFYISGILFFLYIARIILKGNFMFSISGLIICSLGVFIPVVIGSFFLLSSISEGNYRIRIMKVFVIIVFAFYIVLLINMLFLTGHRKTFATASIAEYSRFSINLIPFKTISGYILSFIDDSMNKSIVFQNILGNMFLLAPMGILLPCIFKGLRRFDKFVIIIFMIPVLIEVCQLLMQAGSCDIDDVILNFAGGVLFFGLFKLKVIQKILCKMYIII